MKQLTIFEMESISGGYSWDFSSFQSSITSIVCNGVEAVASAVLLGTGMAAMGTLIGGTQSGANGGILGFGLLGNAVGMVWGLIVGGVTGVVNGAVMGWDASVALVEEGIQGLLAGTFMPWKS